MRWFTYWVEERFNWFVRLGVQAERLRKREYSGADLAHYSKATTDIEYDFPFGWGELEGIAHRGTFDLEQHVRGSGKDLAFFDEESKEKFLPAVIEPSLGVDRALLVFLFDAYERGDRSHGAPSAPAPRTVQSRRCSRSCATSPTSLRLASNIERSTCAPHSARCLMIPVTLASATIAKTRSARRFASRWITKVSRNTDVTVRDRDSKRQERIGVDRLAEYLKERTGQG